MKLARPRTLYVMSALALGLIAVAACGSGGGHTFTRLSISPGEVQESAYATAFEVLSHHRELIVFEDRIGFRGGGDLDGLDRQVYSVPILMVDGDRNLNDPITVLRRIPAEEIAAIELWRASMVPPEYRRSGWQGGVISIRTR
jgi:hypothetical protein